MNHAARIGDVAEIMLDYVENNKTHLTGEVMRVPSASYTDANQWLGRDGAGIPAGAADAGLHRRTAKVG